MEESAISSPNSDNAEKGILSTIMQSGTEPLDIAELRGLTDEHFFNPIHAKFYRIITDLVRKNGSSDLMAVYEIVGSQEMEKLGGTSYLTEIYTYTPSDHLFESYIDTIIDKHIRRVIIAKCKSTVEAALDQDSDTGDSIAALNADLDYLLQNSTKTSHEANMGEVMQDCMDGLAAIMEGKDVGLKTSITGIDMVTGGLQAGELSIIAARPSVGKTALAATMMEEIAINNKIPCLFLSLEMMNRGVGFRFLSMRTGINLASMTQQQPTRDDFRKIKRESPAIVESPLILDDEGMLTAYQIRSKIKNAIRKHGIKAVFIDYMQLIRGTSKTEQDNPNIRISNALKILKNTAKECNIHICALAQLGRQAEGEMAYRLNNSMVKDCGEIEQDADMIFMIGEHEDGKEEQGNTEDAIVRDINITKNRQGATGTIGGVVFLKTMTKYTNYKRQK